tara:strand:- start:1942 stop:2958 length:1017 start_codon:yes stop_codon:yes gene_type:complete
MKLQRSRIVRVVTVSLAVLGVAVIGPAPVNAFGTINGAGQNGEHGRITRQALGCTPLSGSGDCFEDKTLDSLAGKAGTFGAVGAPDRGRGMLTSYAHCSAGDYLDVAGYPRSKAEAQAVMQECRAYMAENLAHAVTDAADLLDDQGAIRRYETSLTFDCTYAGSQHGRAKCNILAHLGRLLHASQDFYAHSNWVDRPDSGRAISVLNPPGLDRHGPAPWLDLRLASPAFPDGLLSGCFDNISFVDENRGCLYGDDGEHRVRHANLNKDRGVIDEVIGTGTTERGAMNDNFRHAVEAAIADSADKWATYRELLLTTYGPDRGTRMACALTRDDPARDCP